MTTIAFDGTHVAADTLVTDCFGLRDTHSKIFTGRYFVAGGSGEVAQLLAWYRKIQDMTLPEVLRFGYPDFVKGSNDPCILLAKKGAVYGHTSGHFIRCKREFHAVGSGRDYALAAMHLGKSAKEAVEIAALFDINTGGEIECHRTY